jgi:hypothetical protein
LFTAVYAAGGDAESHDISAEATDAANALMQALDEAAE